MRRLVAVATFVASFAFVSPVFAGSDSVADFYRGKSIRLLISSGPGSGYDSYARLLARHLGDHIPGHPNFIPQNMPAAGGAALLNSAYNKGPFDGSLIFGLHFNLPLNQVIGGKSVHYDIARMKAIGRLLASNAATGIFAKSKTGIRTLDDARHREAVIGSTSATSVSTIFPTILKKMAGAKFKVVSGYDDVFLAMERGEIDGFGSYSYMTFKSIHPDYLTKKLFYPIVQWGAEREAAWPDVPTAADIAKTPRDKRAMEIVSSTSDIGFSYFMPPGVPANRAKALQDAFNAMVKDPAFLADAKKSNLFLRTAQAKEVEEIVGNVLTAPPDVVSRVVELMKVD
ncbi:MAG TPA: hypothetical protein VL402_10775 [Xanthobacteraceae bacterium]|nr:hypothetical protein [Xanthobacteraceae bacterium]